MKDIKYSEKILSHRLRGFSSVEHTFQGLVGALKADTPYLEVDTRVSADGKIYLFHNAKISCGLQAPKLFMEMNSREIEMLRYPDGHRVLLMEDALAYFKDKSNGRQKLCIDIKDFGNEKEHLDLVEKYGLSEHVSFVSWIPETLIRLAEIDGTIPLVFSHINIMRAGKTGRFLLSRTFQKPLKIGRFVVLANNRNGHDFSPYYVGFQHGFISQELPERLLFSIANTRGGICVHKEAVCPPLLAYCRHNGIELWVFSVQTRKQFHKYASIPEIKVVFCDDVPRLNANE